MANSAKCPKCGAQSLKWDRTDPTAPRLLHYFGGTDANGFRYYAGDEHVCAAVRLALSGDAPEISTEPDGERDMPPEVRHQATVAAGLDADAVRVLVRENLTELAAGAASAAVSVAVTGVREQVAAAVADMVPVTHRIEIVRPDGVKVEFDGRPHRTFARLLHRANVRKPNGQHLNLMVVGPAGGGKTTAARMLADALGVPYREQSMGPQTSEAKLLGFVSPTTLAYVRTPFREAYEYGGVMMLDEIDNSNASVLTVLNSALANGHCTFADGVEIPRHADFILVAGANTYGRGADRVYVGRQPLDGATLDRFAVIDWDYDEDAELVWAGAGADVRDWVVYVQRVRKAVFDLKLRIIVSPRASIDGGAMLRASAPRHEVEDETIWKGVSDDDRAKVTANL